MQISASKLDFMKFFIFSGVMMSHDNLTWMAKQVCNYLGVTSNDSLVSYLPLSHSAAQMVDVSEFDFLTQHFDAINL